MIFANKEQIFTTWDSFSALTDYRWHLINCTPPFYVSESHLGDVSWVSFIRSGWFCTSLPPGWPGLDWGFCPEGPQP